MQATANVVSVFCTPRTTAAVAPAGSHLPEHNSVPYRQRHGDFSPSVPPSRPPKRWQHSPLGVQGKLDVSDVCPTGRIRDMCHVEAAHGNGGDDDGWRNSLVTVTSAGGVHVWGVPALDGVDVEGTGSALTMPLLATYSSKVGRGAWL